MASKHLVVTLNSITSTKEQQPPSIGSPTNYFNQLHTSSANVENSLDYQETMEIPPL